MGRESRTRGGEHDRGSDAIDRDVSRRGLCPRAKERRAAEEPKKTRAFRIDDYIDDDDDDDDDARTTMRARQLRLTRHMMSRIPRRSALATAPAVA